MLKEAYRVVKKGGRVGVSVWGRPEHSLISTLFSNIFEKHGIQMPKTRSPFYLNDKEKLVKMLEDTGFRDVLTW